MLLSVLDLPGRDAAREAAHRELAKQPYQAAKPSWLRRLITWAWDKLGELLSTAGHVVPGGPWGLAALAAVVVLLVALLVIRLRPARRISDLGSLFDLEIERTAQEHRDLAASHAARGDYREAGQERFRAVVRELESRGVLDPRPGRTADEVAWEAGALVPHLRDALVRGARLFDDLRYGERPADADEYAVLVALDDEVRTSRLVLA